MAIIPEQLTPAEQALGEAFPLGTPVDLGGTPDAVVRAEVVAALLRRARPAEGGEAARLHLLNATVTGLLDLTYSDIGVLVRFEDCRFDTEPDLTGAVVRGLKLLRCELPGLVGRLMRVAGDLDLRGTTIRGRLSLVRATITGELRLHGANLVNPGAWALFAGGLVVESALFGSFTTRTDVGLQRPLRVEGGLRLAGARVLGSVFFDGVHIRNPGGTAIHGDNLTVFGRMVCGDGFLAEGRIHLPHARIEGELTFAGATLGDADLILRNTVVNDLNLRTATPITGLVDLRHVRSNVVRDARETWPARLALDGFVYDTIDHDGSTVAHRLNWLRRDPDGFRPQPYEQLAAHYRRLGADSEARRVLLNKQRQQRRHLRLPGRLLGRVLDGTVGYGYRPWQAAVWLAVMVGIGTAVFSAWPPTPDRTARRFDAAMYTLDLLLPISAFGLRDAFAPVGSTRWLAYGLTAAGWLLVTALIAGVTRAVRRD